MAVAASAAAFGVGVMLHRPQIELSPFLVFYAAVAVSAWYGGFGPGLLVTVVGSLVVDYYLFDPPNSFLLKDYADAQKLVLFASVGVVISWLNGQLLKAKSLCEVQALAARRSEIRAKRLSEANLIAVFFADIDGNIHTGNDEFLRLAGCTREELHDGRINWLKISAPEHRTFDEAAVDELKRCRVCTPFEREHLLNDGRRIPVLVGCAMLDDPPDECVGFVLDLTERKRVEGELRVHRGRLAALSLELMVAEERERRRIATVLHDSIGQTLALAKLQLDRAGQSEPGKAVAGRLVGVAALIDDVIARARSLTSEISPPILYELGLEAAIRWLAGKLEQEHAIRVSVHDDRQPKPLQPTLRLVLFEAVRELLFNVAKHASSNTCSVSVSRDGDMVRIVVQDDGKGFDPAHIELKREHQHRFGLFSARERLDRLGGSMEVRAQVGQGTSVSLLAPLASASSLSMVTQGTHDKERTQHTHPPGGRPPDHA